MTPRWDSRGRSALPLAGLVSFGVGFGFVEAAVVYYLRTVIGSPHTYALGHYRVLVNFGVITFISSLHSFLPTNLARVEVVREAATILMLAGVALAAGRSARQRWGAFLIGFSCWDLSYYLFLRIISGWPTSLFTRDVFFLIPVPWIGPVLTPLVIFSVALVVGVRLYQRA